MDNNTNVEVQPAPQSGRPIDDVIPPAPSQKPATSIPVQENPSNEDLANNEGGASDKDGQEPSQPSKSETAEHVEGKLKSPAHSSSLKVSMIVVVAVVVTIALCTLAFLAYRSSS